jgi:hypothetical protein
MRHPIFAVLIIVLACSVLAVARGEIPAEHRDKADYVVSGVVEAVYLQDKGYYHHYIVELRVDEVAKGKELKAGSTFYVSCFRRKADAPREPSASGHEPPPQPGQRITAFVRDSKGKHRAIYPNWFDELKPARSE